jgi:hypothetical protein
MKAYLLMLLIGAITMVANVFGSAAQSQRRLAPVRVNSDIGRDIASRIARR